MEVYTDTMNRMDAFSGRHPAVNFVFFVLVVCFGVTVQHPAYLLAGILGAAVYYLLLSGRRGLRWMLGLLPFPVLVALINPLFNTYGEHVLLTLLGRPYTLEALAYGFVIAGMLAVMFLWFGCYNQVMTSDKFTSLFGSVIPSLSLLLVMVLRMVPNLLKKAKQIGDARRCIGKGAGEQASFREKLTEGLALLSALVSWALEGSIVTADSMRSRGYGSAKRTSFMRYKLTGFDYLLLGIMLLLAAVTAYFSLSGSTQAEFTPNFYIAPVAGRGLWGFVSYCLLLLLPTLLHIKEAVQWYISRSKI